MFRTALWRFGIFFAHKGTPPVGKCIMKRSPPTAKGVADCVKRSVPVGSGLQLEADGQPDMWRIMFPVRIVTVLELLINELDGYLEGTGAIANRRANE